MNFLLKQVSNGLTKKCFFIILFWFSRISVSQ